MTKRLIMRVGADRFAMSVEHVVRVSLAQEAEPLPFVPAHVEGLAVYGSDVVPQISLAASVGMKTPDQAGGFVTLADTASGIMALRHNGFEGVHTFPDGRLAPVAAPPGDCRTGMIRLAGKRVFAVDAQRIRIPTIIGTSPMVPMEPIEEPRVAAESGKDKQNAGRALGFRLHGREYVSSLDLIDRIETSQDGQTRLVLHSDWGWAVLEVESVSGLSSSAENVKLSDALLGELTWSTIPAHGRTDAVNDETATLPVFQLKAGRITCVISRRAITLVSAMAYVPAPWMTERFDGLAATAQGILPVVDLSRRLGQGAERGGVCVAIQTHDEVWALACDRVVDAGQARPFCVDGSPPWSSGVVELQGGTCPLLDLDHVMSLGWAA